MKFDPAILLFALMVIAFAWRGCESVEEAYATSTVAP